MGNFEGSDMKIGSGCACLLQRIENPDIGAAKRFGVVGGFARSQLDAPSFEVELFDDIGVSLAEVDCTWITLMNGMMDIGIFNPLSCRCDREPLAHLPEVHLACWMVGNASWVILPMVLFQFFLHHKRIHCCICSRPKVIEFLLGEGSFIGRTEQMGCENIGVTDVDTCMFSWLSKEFLRVQGEILVKSIVT